MKDSFNRSIDYLRISVTDRCNERCIYCMPEEGVNCVSHESILSYDEILKVVKALSECGIRSVRLTGGEPLVRRGLPSLVKQIRDIPGIERIAITTNGLLLADQIEALHEAGLTHINMSLDTMDPDFYQEITRIGSLDKAMEGLKAALAYDDLTIKIDCVLTGSPRQKLIDVASLAKDYPIHVRFIEMMPIGLGKAAFEHEAGYHFIPMSEVKSKLEEAYGPLTPFEGNARAIGSGPATYMTIPGFKGMIGFIPAVSHEFCDRCNRVRLTSQGFLKACLQYDLGVDLREILRNGGDENAIAQAFSEVMRIKPKGHHFNKAREDHDETLNMHAIGG
ncbi:MAG: GTP 3',8-cyclase MoaA [Lachnospiraceae bacterium]|nr:GTP 3',8-cyclase MoaA [Candidatus Equihabitans merdae]